MSDTPSDGIERHLWMLFSDVNARFNILIEECAHLQDTIYGYFPNESKVRTYIREQEEKTRNDPFLRDAGIYRAVTVNAKIEENYRSIPAWERTSLALWNSLGGLVIGLVVNQDKLRVQFKRAILARLASTSDGPSRQIDVYWFMAMRGYFISQGFQFYTRQLEHAHEKVIQILENRAGNLPAPILLRRWNSALYGEFLSSYSRHINREANWLICRLMGKDDSEIEEERTRSYISHAWSHHPTSTTTEYSVSKQNISGNGEFNFGSIQSAYFYLDQPILFPLLYHECVHINFPHEDISREKFGFFEDRIAAVEALRFARLGDSYENFWNHFTEEIWADVISITLSGKSYLAALVLQHFGMSGIHSFSHFDVEKDRIHPINELATEDKKQYEAVYPTEDDAYFWEARLRIALRVCKAIHGDDKEVNRYCDSLEELLGLWFTSGQQVFAAERTSNEHQQLWHHRKELNGWAEATVIKFLSTHISKLGSEKGLMKVYRLPADVCKGPIQYTIDAYFERYFLWPPRSDLQTSQNNELRLEDVALYFRWETASMVMERIQCAPEKMDVWIRGYCNWLRSDGGTAVRIGLEWCLARYSLMDFVLDYFRAKGRSPSSEDVNTKATPSATDSEDIRSELLQHISADHEITKELVEYWFPQRRFDHSAKVMPKNMPVFNSSIDKLVKKIEGLATKMLRAIVSMPDGIEKERGVWPPHEVDGKLSHRLAEVKVGTLSLGVMRSPQIDHVGKSPYVHEINGISDHAQLSADRRNSFLTKHGVSHRVTSHFLPLIGEYNFLTYLEGCTPVERGIYPQSVPHRLTKPRLVLQVLGKGLPNSSEVGKPIGKVSLLKFQYRWQWYQLWQKLTNDPNVGATQLFLSSAWEDAILVTWHENDQKLMERLYGLVADVDSGVEDSQSNLACFALQKDGTYNKDDKHLLSMSFKQDRNWINSLQDWKKQSSRAIRVSIRTGRTDYSLIWDRNCPDGTVLESCCESIKRLPYSFWQKISTFSTAYEIELKPNGGSVVSNPIAITTFSILQ
jgi:hypothetical protein